MVVILGISPGKGCHETDERSVGSMGSSEMLAETVFRLLTRVFINVYL